MARKRPRVQTVRPRSTNKPPHSSGKPRDDENDPQGSRLKKARFIGEQKPTSPESAHKVAVQLAEATRKVTEAKIATLQTRIDAFLKTSLESRLSVLPDVELLVAIADTLATVPVPTVIARLGKVPRILLIAARRGINEGPASSSRGATALAHALTIFAKGADVVIPDSDRGLRTTRSAFHPTEHDSFSRVELEAVQRAGKWALQLLTSCARGDGDKEGKMDAIDSQGIVGHGNTSRVFVTPRDSLDAVMLGHYTSSIIARVDAIVNCSSTSGRDKVRLVHVICRKLCRLAHTTAFVPVVEGVLSSTAKIHMPIQRSGANVMKELLDSSFVECVLGSAEHRPFDEMNEDARFALVTLSHRVWLTHLDAVENRFCRENELSEYEQRQGVHTLATAAAEHVGYHWELMDEVRRAVSGGMEPFSTRLWKRRMFYRVVLSEVVDKINSSANSKKNGLVTPLFRRFPVRFREMIRNISILANSMLQDGQQWIKNPEPGPIALAMIYDTFRMDAVCNVPANAHTVLLCIEGVIEKLCWASGFTAARRDIDGRSTLPVSNDLRIFTVLSTVIAMIEVIRLPGGAWAENKQVFETRAQALQRSLHVICTQKGLPSNRTDEWRLSGLLAMTISGAVCASNLKGLRKFYAALDPVEKKEMRRALETSVVLTNNREHVRAMNACAEIMS